MIFEIPMVIFELPNIWEHSPSPACCGCNGPIPSGLRAFIQLGAGTQQFQLGCRSLCHSLVCCQKLPLLSQLELFLS